MSIPRPVDTLVPIRVLILSALWCVPSFSVLIQPPLLSPSRSQDSDVPPSWGTVPLAERTYVLAGQEMQCQQTHPDSQLGIGQSGMGVSAP